MADAAEPVLKPADELRAAAAKLREMAAETTRGKWEAVNDAVGGGEVAVGVWSSTGVAAGKYVAERIDSRFADASWIALMCPDKAELLAVWLETEAHCLGVGDDVGKHTADLLDAVAGEPLKLNVIVVADTSVPALAFARAILR